MSVTTDSMSSAAQRRAGTPLRRAAWLREPLLHFVLLGGVLFLADHVLVARREDPRVIHLDAAVDRQAREIFSSAQGREPVAQELESLRQAWLDNEVLYREGLAMQVDRGDDAIRERVIFKALSIVDANVKLPAPDEAALRTYFQAHRGKYDEPARFDFEEAVLNGEADESAVRAFVARLNGGSAGEANAGLRVFKGRPLANLSQAYGEGFAEELGRGPAGEWRALRTSEGWRAVRLTRETAARPAVFEEMAPVVLQDWKDAEGARQRSDAVHALARKYRVVRDAL